MMGTELKLARERAGLSPEIDDALNSFAAENDLTVPPVARHATHAPLARDIPFITHAPHVPLAPVRPARGRARLALTVLALLATAGWGAYLYESSRPLELEVIAVSAPGPASPADMAMVDAAAAQSEARPNDPSLAFNESAVSPEADRKADSGGNASGATASEFTRPIAPVSSTAAQPDRPAPRAAAASAPLRRPVEPPASSAATARPQSVGTSASLAGAVQNVSGEWRLATQVETTSYSAFAGLKLGYEMKLEQDGDRVTGAGKKVSENEKGIGPGAQTPVTVSGTIAGDRLTLNFVERGTQRETRGKFVLLVDEAGTLWGRFSSTAARSSGHVEAHRVSMQ
jgi:hypothetical protein